MAQKRDIEKVKKQVAKFKEMLIEKGFDDAKVLLFGSWVKNQVHEGSDIDVCVVSKKFVGNRFDDMINMNILANQVNDLIEVAPMTPEEFDDKYSTLAYEVKKWGLSI